MSRRTTRRPGRRAKDDHPSIWFFVALGIGIVLVIWVYSRVAMKPVKKKGEGRREKEYIAARLRPSPFVLPL